MIIGNSLEALISDKRFYVETIFPPDLIEGSGVRNDWHEMLVCQGLGEKRIIIDYLHLTAEAKSAIFSKGDIVFLQIGLDVSEKMPGVGLMTVSWHNEFDDIDRRSFLEKNSSKNGVWKDKSFYIIDLSIIEKLGFLKLGKVR